MKFVRLLSTTLVFLAFWLASAIGQNCKYTLNLYDGFGDGWSDGVLNINLNGVDNLYTIDPPTGPGMGQFATFQVNVTEGQVMKLSFKEGFVNYDISWVLLDNNGDTVTTQDVVPFPGLVSDEYFTGTVSCGGCPKPQNLSINPFAYTAKLRWTGPSANYHIVYGLASVNLLAGQGDTITTNQLKYTLTGLFENTPYQVMIYRDCPDGSVSTIAGPVVFSTYFSDDVGVSQVISPVSDCDLGQEQVVVTLKNFGANPQSLVKFWYSIDGQVANIPFPNDGFYTGVLGKDSAEYIQFETFGNLSGPGQHILKVWTELAGDDQTSNDTITYYLTNKVGLPYHQNFDDWNGGWYVDLVNSENPSWEHGHPNKPFNLTEAASGENCWATSLTGNYNLEETSYLVSPCFDFSTAAIDPTIRFSLWLGADSFYDGMYLDMSDDNGQTWERVGEVVTTPTNPTNWYEFINTSQNLGDVWSGFSGGWVTARHKLDGSKGKANVQLRFGVGAGLFFTNAGFAIDDINIFEQKQKDLTPLSGSTPGAGLCGLANDKLTINVRNDGSAVASGANGAIKLGYQVDNDPPVIETVSGFSVAANAEKTYTFTTTFNSIGFHTIKVWTAFTGDQNIENDTAVFTINNVIKSLPLKEDFETGLFPQDWATDFSTFVTDQHNAPSFVLAKNLFSFSTDYIVEIPAFGTIAAEDTLSFDYRMVDYNFDTQTNGTIGTVLDAGIEFLVQASVDCGTTWTTIHTINEATHVTSANMKKVKISLAQFAGKVIKLQLVGLNDSPDADFWFDLDNVNINGCPESFDIDITVNNDANQTMNLASALLEPHSGTPPFTYNWSNGGSGSLQVGLANGAYKVTVTDKNGCSEIVDVYVEVVGTNNIEGLKNYNLMPNPTSGQSVLLADFAAPVDAQIEIVNMLGELVYQASENGSAQIRHNLELENQPAGIYLVRLKVDGRVKISKLVLTR